MPRTPRHAGELQVVRDLRAIGAGCLVAGIDGLQFPHIVDQAYEGNETRDLAQSLGFEPVVPRLETR